MSTDLRRRAPLAAVILVLAAHAGSGLRATQADPETPERRIEHGDIVRIFSGDIEIPRGVERRGSIVSIGGDVRIDGVLDGDAVVIFGTLHATGEVEGQVVGVMTDLTLDGARVGDQVVSVLGGLERRNVSIGDGVVHIGIPGMRVPGLLTLLAWLRLAALLFVFVLLVLLVALVPERVAVIAEDAPVRYVQAFFVGVLGYIAALSVLLLVSVTLIGGPLAYVAFVAAKWLGVAGLFYAIGRRFARGFGRDLSPFAAVLLVFGVYAAILLGLGTAGFPGLVAIAVIRLLFLCLFEIPGLGLVLLTRAGARGAGRPVPLPIVPLSPTPPGAAAAPAGP
jgi:hypothetical protein